MHMNVNAKVDLKKAQEEVSKELNKQVRLVENEGCLKVSYNTINNHDVNNLFELNQRYEIEIKRSGTTMTGIIKPKRL